MAHLTIGIKNEDFSLAALHAIRLGINPDNKDQATLLQEIRTEAGKRSENELQKIASEVVAYATTQLSIQATPEEELRFLRPV